MLIDFLIRAEKYADSTGDLGEFSSRYAYYRQNHSIKESTWKSLDYLYGQDVANRIEQQTGSVIL